MKAENRMEIVEGSLVLHEVEFRVASGDEPIAFIGAAEYLRHHRTLAVSAVAWDEEPGYNTLRLILYDTTR